MPEGSNKFRILFLRLAGVGLVLVILEMGLYFFVGQVIGKELDSLVRDKTNNLYYLETSQIDCNIFEGNIRIWHLQILPDSFEWKHQDSLRVSEGCLKIREFSMEGFQWLHFLFSKEMKIHKLRFNTPVFYYKRKSKSTYGTGVNRIPGVVMSFCQLFQVDSVIFQNMSFFYAKQYAEKPSQEAEDISLILHNIKVDSTKSGKPFYADSFKVYVPSYRFVHGSTTIEVKELFAGTDTPLKIGYGFLKNKKGNDETTIDAFISDCIASEIEYYGLIHHKDIVISSLKIDSCSLKIREKTNSSLHSSNSDKQYFFPSDLLRKLEAYLKIDSLAILSGNVSYHQFEKNIKQPFVFEFDRLKVKAHTLTNDPEIMKPSNPAFISASFRLYQSAPMDILFQIPLLDADKNFSYSGTLRALSASLVNHLMVGEQIRFKRGFLKYGKFDFRVKRGAARGKVTLKYQNVEVNILKKNNLKLTFANMFVKTNSDGTKSTYVTIDYNRRQNFFEFISSGLLIGVEKILVEEPGSSIWVHKPGG